MRNRLLAACVLALLWPAAALFGQYDATKPADNSPMLASEIRNNHAVLKTKIDDSGYLKTALYRGTPATSNSGTGETDLWTQSVPVTLAAAGDAWHVFASFTVANNANTKTIKLHSGSESQSIVFSNAVASHKVWLDLRIVRGSSASTGYIAGMIYRGATDGTGAATVTPMVFETALSSQAFGGATTVKITGQSNTAGGDVTLNTYTIVLEKG